MSVALKLEKRLRLIVIGTAVVLALSVNWALGIYNGAIRLTAIDYDVFWNAARSTDVYAASLHPFPYPPTALPLTSLLGAVAYWPGFVIFTAISIGAFIYASMKHFCTKAVMISLISPAVFSCIQLGQTSMLLSAGLLFGFSGGPVSTGIALGVVASIKPQLMFLAPFALIARRDWQALSSAAAAFTLAVSFSLLIYGTAAWFDWIGLMPSFREALVTQNILDRAVSIAAFSSSYGYSFALFFVSALVLAAALLVWLAPQHEGGQLACLIIGFSVVAAPYSLLHDTVALVPLAASILMAKGFRLSTVPAFLLFALGAAIPAAVVTSYLLVRDKLGVGRSSHHPRGWASADPNS